MQFYCTGAAPGHLAPHHRDQAEDFPRPVRRQIDVLRFDGARPVLARQQLARRTACAPNPDPVVYQEAKTEAAKMHAFLSGVATASESVVGTSVATKPAPVHTHRLVSD